MISQLNCELQAFWSDLFPVSTKILFTLLWYLVAVVGDVIAACHHQTWEVQRSLSQTIAFWEILHHRRSLMSVSHTVSHAEENTHYMSCQKSLPLSPTTQTAKTLVTYYHVVKANISVALKKTMSNWYAFVMFENYRVSD